MDKLFVQLVMQKLIQEMDGCVIFSLAASAMAATLLREALAARHPNP
jgi:hypothetical protein